MILNKVDAVSTSEPGTFAWSMLRRFQNVDFVTREIVARHKLNEPKGLSNAKKQAQQLRYCLVQAREYFLAAKAVSLATKPNLLYYGTMSLALAEILMKQSGLSSLDKAREEHRHHGLLVIAERPLGGARDLITTASCLRAQPLEIEGRRRGTFELWHRSCRECPLVGEIHTNYQGGGSTTSVGIIFGAADHRLDLVPSSGITLYDLLRSLPLLSEYIASHGQQPPIVRCKADMRTHPNGRQIVSLAIHPSGYTQSFIDNFKIEAGWVDRTEILEVPNGYLIRLTYDAINGVPQILIPHGSMHTTDEVRFWTTNQCLNEFGFFYVALFIAGNYARYFPDRWLQDVERSTPLADAVEELCSAAETRVPWLTLCELSTTCYVRGP